MVALGGVRQAKRDGVDDDPLAVPARARRVEEQRRDGRCARAGRGRRRAPRVPGGAATRGTPYDDARALSLLPLRAACCVLRVHGERGEACGVAPTRAWYSCRPQSGPATRASTRAAAAGQSRSRSKQLVGAEDEARADFDNRSVRAFARAWRRVVAERAWLCSTKIRQGARRAQKQWSARYDEAADVVRTAISHEQKCEVGQGVLAYDDPELRGTNRVDEDRGRRQRRQPALCTTWSTCAVRC